MKREKNVYKLNNICEHLETTSPVIRKLKKIYFKIFSIFISVTFSYIKMATINLLSHHLSPFLSHMNPPHMLRQCFANKHLILLAVLRLCLTTGIFFYRFSEKTGHAFILHLRATCRPITFFSIRSWIIIFNNK